MEKNKKKHTMIFINKLQKHIKNKKYMIWVEWDFKSHSVIHSNGDVHRPSLQEDDLPPRTLQTQAEKHEGWGSLINPFSCPTHPGAQCFSDGCSYRDDK